MENGRIARINRGNVAKFRGGGKGKGQTTTPIVDGIDFMKQTAGNSVNTKADKITKLGPEGIVTENLLLKDNATEYFADISGDINAQELRALAEAGENNPAVESALKNLIDKLKATNEALGEKQAKLDQMNQQLDQATRRVDHLEEQLTSVGNDARAIRLIISGESTQSATTRISRYIGIASTGAGYLLQGSAVVWKVAAWGFRLGSHDHQVPSVMVSGTDDVMYATGSVCRYIGEKLRAKRESNLQVNPTPREGGHGGPRRRELLLVVRRELPLKGEAGPDYWKMLGEGIDDWNPDHFLQSLLEEFKEQEITVDVEKWQDIDVPDVFNHIYGWLDAVNVDFWNDCANQVGAGVKSKEAIATEIVTTEFFRTMSQLSDETYKGDFVWEDPSSETKLIQDLFTEFNKGGVKSVYSYMAAYKYQDRPLLREVGCEVVLKALVITHLVI